MALTLRIPVLLAGAIAAAISLAPVAAADPGPDDTPGSSSSVRADASSPSAAGARAGSDGTPANNGQLSSDFASDDVPTGWKNEALWARPGGSNPFGAGPKPPVLALD